MSRHIVTSYNQIQFYALTVADTFWPQSDHKGSNISLGQPQHHGLACSLKQNPYLSNATYRSSATIIYRQCQKRFHHCWPEKGHVWHRCFASQDPDANRLHKLLARLVDSEAWVQTNTIVGLHVCFFLLLVLEFQDVHPNVSRATRLPAGCVVVSSNAEQYRIVDVSGAPDGSCIRERILSKVRRLFICLCFTKLFRLVVHPGQCSSELLDIPVRDWFLCHRCCPLEHVLV